MNILQISTYDIRGGAALASHRLHKALRQLGQNSQMIVRYKDSVDDSVIPVRTSTNSPEVFYQEAVIQEYFINTRRTSLSNTIFSFPYPGYDLSMLPVVQAADVINLHWVAGFQSPITLQKLLNLGKPVVWTLHDQWAFTGGCHYSAGCYNYRLDCASCPQLEKNSFNLAATVLEDKVELFKNANLTIVTPSQWLSRCARESALFKDLRLEVIPYSLDVETFSPIPKPEAKNRLGLRPEIVTILFGAVDTKEKRKGFKILAATMHQCLTDVRFQQLIAEDRIKILVFGRPNDDFLVGDIPWISLGYLDSEEKIALSYAAADLFVLPSLEDNLPLTMLEAMSCGTPVIGSNTGGIPDMVKDGVTGKLFSLKEPNKLSEVILSLIFDPKRMETMGQNSRQMVEKNYALSVQGRRYIDLYRGLLPDIPQFVTKKKTLTKINHPEVNSTPIELSVPIDFSFGPYFRQIYNPILFKALQEFSFLINQRWKESETDRAARLKQVEELTRLLKESETDRANRLDVILFSQKMITGQTLQIQELEKNIKTIRDENEKNRNDGLEQINQLSHLMKESEEERAAQLKQIEELSQTLAAQRYLLESTQTQLEKLMGLPEIRLRKKLSGLLKKYQT